MEERKLKELAETLPTPSYIFDTDMLMERLSWTAGKLCPAKLCFAVKANPFLVGFMDAFVERYEVCSPGEFHICVKNKIPMEKVVLSGVYKEEKDVRYAMERGVVHYTAESKRQFDLVQQCAADLGKTVEILLRVTSGNQFGMCEEDVTELIRRREQVLPLQIAGLQYFTGTQKKSIQKIKGELQYIEGLLQRLSEEEGFAAKVLEFGPGLGVPYFTKEDPKEDAKLLEDFAQLMEEKRPYELVFEMGRFLAASCGYYVTEVVDQKKNNAVNV